MNALFRQDRFKIVAEVTFSLNPAASVTAGWTYMKPHGMTIDELWMSLSEA